MVYTIMASYPALADQSEELEGLVTHKHCGYSERHRTSESLQQGITQVQTCIENTVFDEKLQLEPPYVVPKGK